MAGLLGFLGSFDVFFFGIHRNCLFLWSSDVFLGGSDVFHYDLRGDSLGVLSMWQRGLLILVDLGMFWRGLEGFVRMDTSGLPIFMEFRCILFEDTSEYDIFDASRCI